MERYLVGTAYCDDKIRLNLRSMSEMLDEVLSEKDLDEGDKYFFNEMLSHLSDVDKYYSWSNGKGDSWLTISWCTESLIESAEILAQFWYDQQQSASEGTRILSERLRWVIAFTCMSFSEYCIDLLQIVQSANEVDNLHCPYVMLYYMMTEMVGTIAGYAGLKGFDLGQLNDGNIIVDIT